HSPVGEREESGELTELEAMSHPRRNEVFRDVGSEEHEPGDPDFIEILRIPFEPDSALALCSDGLSDLVPSPMIRRAVETHAGYPDAAVRELIAAANSAGGKDNVTVIVVEGPRFTAPAPVAAWAGWNLIASRPAWFLCGLLAAAAGMWFSRGRWIPKPPAVRPPRVLTAGPGAAFSSISDALAQARPGDTVEALAGEYSEQVRLKSGVSLRTRDAILRAAPIHDCSGAGILISGPSQPWISHNTLRGNKTGLAAHDGARPALEGNLFDKNSTQVELPAEMPMKDVRAHNTFIDAKPAGGRKP